MRRDRLLENKGYRFSGQYASGPEGKEQMKTAAAQWRKKGYFATVYHEVYNGRVTSSDGYSVFIKSKNVEPNQAGHLRQSGR